MDSCTRSSKKDRVPSNRSTSARRETSSNRQASTPQQQRGPMIGSTRPEAFYAGEPLSAIRARHNSGVGRNPDPDTNSAPNSPLPRLRISGSSATLGEQVQQVRQVSSLPRQQQRDNTTIVATSVRRSSHKSSPNDYDDFIRSSSGKYYNHHAGISRREIIGRRCVGTPPQQPDDNIVERFSRTLRNPWNQRNAKDENPNRIPKPYLDERPSTLPSIVRKSRGAYVESYNTTDLFPDGKRISRQDILNRRTSSFGGNNTSYGLIRRKSSGALEVAGLTITDFYRNEEAAKCDDFVRKNASFVKNSSTSQQRLAQQQSNAAKSRRDGSLERSRTGGSRSVADFLTVSTRLQDMTRGLVPRPSTLPKIVHTSKAESDWTGRTPRDLASREAPIYGRIRRRKLSLPVANRDSQIRKSTSSLARFVRGKSNVSNDSDLDGGSGEIQKITRRSCDFSYQRNKEECFDMRVECKKNSGYGRVLRTNTSSSKSSSQGTRQDVKERRTQERRSSITNERKSFGQVTVASGKELRQVSRKRIIDNVEDTNDGSISSPRTDSMREVDYATIDFGMGKSSGMTRRRESTLGGKKIAGSVNESENKLIKRNGERKSDESTWNRGKDKSRISDDRGKRGESRSGPQEVSSRSSRSNHASTTLPLYAKSVRKNSSCASSSVPVKIVTKIGENRQGSKVAKATTKSVKDRTNYVKKSVAAHVKSFSEANSPRSMSPAPSSSIFGFCTGRRRVREETKKNREEHSTSRTVGIYF